MAAEYLSLMWHRWCSFWVEADIGVSHITSNLSSHQIWPPKHKCFEFVLKWVVLTHPGRTKVRGAPGSTWNSWFLGKDSTVGVCIERTSPPILLDYRSEHTRFAIPISVPTLLMVCLLNHTVFVVMISPAPVFLWWWFSAKAKETRLKKLPSSYSRLYGNGMRLALRKPLGNSVKRTEY